MARILLTVWPFPTHLPVFFSVADALCRRGHDVGIYTEPAALTTAGLEGCVIFPFRKVEWASIADAVGKLVTAAGKSHAKFWQEFLVRSLPDQLADIRSICADWDPDCLICD